MITMTEQGRVLSEEEIQHYADTVTQWTTAGYIHEVVPNLIATIRDRDKTIAEKDADIERLRRKFEQWNNMVDGLPVSRVKPSHKAQRGANSKCNKILIDDAGAYSAFVN